jgi:hypothetical protein
MAPVASEFEQEFVVIRRRKRYDERNAARRRNRLMKNRSLYPDLLLHERIGRVTVAERPLTELAIRRGDFLDASGDSSRDVRKDTSIRDASAEDPIRNAVNDNPMDIFATIDSHDYSEKNDLQEVSDLSQTDLDDTDSIPEVQSIVSDYDEHIQVRLHEYTSISTVHYCEAFAKLARRANLCKTHTNHFLSFIEAGLPVPNHMPATGEKLLELLAVDDLFTRRSICLLCHRELDYKDRVCAQCASSERGAIAHV